MANIFFKTFLQVALIPSLGVSVAWYGYILSEVLPAWTLTEWVLSALTLTLIMEVIALRPYPTVLLAVVDVLLFLFLLALPAFCIWQNIPIRPYRALDHGGVVLTLFVVALFAFPVRVRLAGYTALDVFEAQGNLPKGSLSDLLKKNTDSK